MERLFSAKTECVSYTQGVLYGFKDLDGTVRIKLYTVKGLATDIWVKY